MTYCTAHQMPAGPRGCPQCLREEAVSRSLESGRFWRWAALVFGSIVGLAALTVALTPSPNRAEMVLDPTPFRSSIETVESALYATGRMTADDRILLRQGLGELQVGLRKLPPSVAQRRALERYDRFCTITPVEADQPGFDVVAARKEWEELRGSHFRAAPWFRLSSVALEQAQTSAGARGIPADAHLYPVVIERLQLLASRAEAELAALPDDPDDLDSDAHDRWRSARSDVQADIARIRQQYPAPFTGMEPHWRRAYDDLEGATRGVAGLLRATTYTATLVPTGSEGRTRVPHARSLIAQAQSSLAAAPR